MDKLANQKIAYEAWADQIRAAEERTKRLQQMRLATLQEVRGKQKPHRRVYPKAK